MTPKSYCGDNNWNITCVQQECDTTTKKCPYLYPPKYLVDLSKDIENENAYCKDIKDMDKITNGKCTGYAGRNQDIDTNREEFVKDFISFQQTHSNKIPKQACATLTAMADKESRFSNKARSWDTMCWGDWETPVKCETPEQYCATNQSWNNTGICVKTKNDGNICKPLRGGFGPLQFDLMWYNGNALKNEKIPVSNYEQFDYLVNGKIKDSDGKTPLTYPDNLKTLFQSCANTTPGGSHYDQDNLRNAVKVCSKKTLWNNQSPPSEEEMYHYSNQICPSKPVTNQCSKLSPKNACGVCKDNTDCGGTDPHNAPLYCQKRPAYQCT
jgi:hypothetical protein